MLKSQVEFLRESPFLIVYRVQFLSAWPTYHRPWWGANTLAGNWIESQVSFGCSNPVYGKTRNPHNLERTPGGSSGGEVRHVLGQQQHHHLSFTSRLLSWQLVGRSLVLAATLEAASGSHRPSAACAAWSQPVGGSLRGAGEGASGPGGRLSGMESMLCLASCPLRWLASGWGRDVWCQCNGVVGCNGCSAGQGRPDGIHGLESRTGALEGAPCQSGSTSQGI